MMMSRIMDIDVRYIDLLTVRGGGEAAIAKLRMIPFSRSANVWVLSFSNRQTRSCWVCMFCLYSSAKGVEIWWFFVQLQCGSAICSLDHHSWFTSFSLPTES